MYRILKGIIAKAAASTPMNAGLTGGFWFKRPPRTNTSFPYVVIEPGAGAELDYDTSKRYVEPINYRFCVVGVRVADIAAIVGAWRDGFNRQSMTIDDGHIMACRLVDEEQIDEAPTLENRECIQHILNFEFKQQQSYV